MGSSGATKPHAVCVPFPAQGHVNPMMQLAKLLHSKGFHITFVNTEFNHKRLIRSKGPEFLLLKLKSLSEVPPVSCIVSDGIMTFGIKVAEEFGIPEVQFWTASACSFMGYLLASKLVSATASVGTSFCWGFSNTLWLEFYFGNCLCWCARNLLAFFLKGQYYLDTLKCTISTK
ncbi:hypothetical protein UlMin_038528 [Ulmus minor]